MSTASRAAYVAVNVIKNALAPVLIPVWPNRKLGLDGAVDEVLIALDEFADAIATVGSLRGRSVLELGPGKTPELLAALVLAGARQGLGIDTHLSVPHDYGDPRRYGPLVESAARGNGARFLAAVGTNPQDMADRLRDQIDRLPVDYRAYDGASMALPDDSMELAISKSVLEHVPRKRVVPLLKELHRVVVPGGTMVHGVDLRDHLRIRDDRSVLTGWLEALTYPDPVFRAMFANRSTYVNRFRAGDWRRMLDQTGWEVTSWKERRWPIEVALRDGSRLQPEWRGVPNHELGVGFIWFSAVARPW